MTRAFRIIQLSDCHVSADPGESYRGVNARQAFGDVLAAAMRWQPDLFLVTGDLSEDFSEAAYEFIENSLRGCEIPVVTTPGNHDLAELQVRYFPDTATAEPLVREAGGWQLIVLNSSVEGEVPGRLSDRMAECLVRALAGNERPVLIALHHQPVPVDSHWIDRYPLREPERLWSILAGHSNVRGVLWGHIHHAWREERHGMLLFGAPSTVANSFPNEREFRPDPAGPGCRWVKLGETGSLATGILRGSERLSLQAAPATG